MNGKFVKILSHKIFTKKRLWGVLSIVLASFAVVITGGLQIANSQSAAINHALGISGSEINYSTDEEYQYFKSAYSGTNIADFKQTI